LVNYISGLPQNIWEIDVNNYFEKNNIQEMLKVYSEMRKIFVEGNHAHLTLITKILLGVFGFVPAFDRYFCDGFKSIYGNQCGFSVLNEKSLKIIGEVYQDNKIIVDKFSEKLFTKDYRSGENIHNYPIGRIIDMYGFDKGYKK
jgi:hypothetical protein